MRVRSLARLLLLIGFLAAACGAPAGGDLATGPSPAPSVQASADCFEDGEHLYDLTAGRARGTTSGSVETTLAGEVSTEFSAFLAPGRSGTLIYGGSSTPDLVVRGRFECGRHVTSPEFYLELHSLDGGLFGSVAGECVIDLTTTADRLDGSFECTDIPDAYQKTRRISIDGTFDATYERFVPET